MDLKEKIEQRRKEREAEAASEAMKKLEAKVAFNKETRAAKDRLTSAALDAVSQASSAENFSKQDLNREDAEKLIDVAANEAVAWWGGTVILLGIGLGILTGVKDSWALGILIAIGAIFLGALLNNELAKQKKEQMLKDHTFKLIANQQLKTSVINALQTQETGFAETQKEN
jgi:Na+/glutamate symporter